MKLKGLICFLEILSRIFLYCIAEFVWNLDGMAGIFTKFLVNNNPAATVCIFHRCILDTALVWSSTLISNTSSVSPVKLPEFLVRQISQENHRIHKWILSAFPAHIKVMFRLHLLSFFKIMYTHVLKIFYCW